MTTTTHESPIADDLAALLRWHLDVGVDETIGDLPVDRYAAASRPQASLTPPPAQQAKEKAVAAPRTTDAAPPSSGLQNTAAMYADAPSAATALQIAQSCNSLADLKSAVESFDGCAMKKFASKTVFADGHPEAKVMIIGEAPGEDEDRQGLPFVGVSGKLLDRMLESIGLDRASSAYITNIVFWRPPGNRKPTSEEVAICLPFVRRHIELLKPRLLVLLGGPSASTMLQNPQGITKLRGKWFDYASDGLSGPVPTIATFHPAYLLRSPQQKRLAWRDLLTVKQKLDSMTGA